MRVRGYDDIFLCSSNELIIKYFNKLAISDYESCTLISPSNRLCAETNKLVRKTLFKQIENLNLNDLILVTQNNLPTGLVNGDLVRVIEIGGFEYRCGMKFRVIEIETLVKKVKKKTTIIEDVLNGHQTNIDNKQHKDLMIDFAIRMRDKGVLQESLGFDEAMKKDKYLNALKAVYGYALTCHKSQGGEWDEVFMLFNKSVYSLVFKNGAQSLHQFWYTAITRAKTKLHIGYNEEWMVE